MNEILINAIELLQKQFPQNSKSSLQKWIKHGRIYYLGRVVKRANQPVSSSGELTLNKKEIQRFSFPVLFEDDDLIVVNKPAQLLSVASLDPDERSVHEYLKKEFKPQKIYPVHRLDREVCGPLIFAKTKRASDALKEAFFERCVKREYKAIVEGLLQPSEGTWESYLEEKANYKVHVTKDQGKHAVTHYTVLDQNKAASLIALTLDTGRKNQLRVHSQQSGHSIVGDVKYGSSFERGAKFALMAHKLDFKHPFTEQELTFEVEPPPFFKKLLHEFKLKF